jgi:hypothetical protein
MSTETGPDHNPTGSFSPAGSRRLKFDEIRIRSQHYETAAVYDANGNEIFVKDGNGNSVNFTPDEIEKLKGAVLTHNHPTSGPLSDDDVFLAVHRGLREIRAVGRDGSLYQLGTTNPEGWTDGSSPEPAIRAEGMLSMYRAIRTGFMAGTRAMIADGKMTIAEANAQYHEQQEAILREFAETYAHRGVYYKKSTRRE